MLKQLKTPDAETGISKFAALPKVEFGQRYAVSKRTVDNWLKSGMPHLKLNPRSLRIPLAEADAWLRGFMTRRNGTAGNSIS